MSNDENNNSENKDKNTLHVHNKINHNNLIYIKDLIQFRKDNIIYFINKNGERLDMGAKKLVEAGKIELYSNYEENTINIQTFNKKKFYGICINDKQSSLNILRDLKKIFKQLESKIVLSKHKLISIALSKFISFVPFTNSVLQTLIDTF